MLIHKRERQQLVKLNLLPNRSSAQKTNDATWEKVLSDKKKVLITKKGYKTMPMSTIRISVKVFTKDQRVDGKVSTKVKHFDPQVCHKCTRNASLF